MQALARGITPTGRISSHSYPKNSLPTIHANLPKGEVRNRKRKYRKLRRYLEKTNKVPKAKEADIRLRLMRQPLITSKSVIDFLAEEALKGNIPPQVRHNSQT